MCRKHIYDGSLGRSDSTGHQGIAMDISAHRRAAAPTRMLLQLAAAAALLAGCGGGGDTGTSSVPAGSSGANTSSFAAGAISGFGSVIVNGVRFDDSAARIADDDGRVADSSALKLGMRVEIDGGAVSDDGAGPRA